MDLLELVTKEVEEAPISEILEGIDSGKITKEEIAPVFDALLGMSAISMDIVAIEDKINTERYRTVRIETSTFRMILSAAIDIVLSDGKAPASVRADGLMGLLGMMACIGYDMGERDAGLRRLLGDDTK